MTLPEELLVKLEKAMNEISYGEAKISWAERGVFIELQVLEKTRFEKPDPYHHG